jgi:hypothetical protein
MSRFTHPALCTLVLGWAVLFPSSFLYAADLLITPGAGSYAAGKDFTVRVAVNPAGGSVNAADGTLSFDSDVLSVSSVSKDGSAFSLWTAEPSFSNAAGTITFSGGTPTAFSNQANVLSITFKGKKEGIASVKFTKGSILAADGKGTDVYTKGVEGSFTITAAQAAPPPPPPKKESPVGVGEDLGGSGTKALPPVVNSTTHPKSDQWYASSTADFNWKPPADVTQVRTILSDKEDAAPTKVMDVASTSERVENIADGTWYFIAQFKNEAGWSDSGRKKIQIDSVPPLEFDVTLVPKDDANPVPKLAFKTSDVLSGLDKYEIILAGAIAATVRAQEATEGTVPVPPQEGGPQLVTIKAYDKAGNVRQLEKTLDLPKVVKSQKGKGEEEQKESPWTSERIALIIAALIIGGLVAWNMHIRTNAQAEKSAILQRVLAMRDKNDRVFSAMREEFEEMINALDERPQLTPSERDFLEKVKEVLDISEGFVDTSIEELKTVVRGK